MIKTSAPIAQTADTPKNHIIICVVSPLLSFVDVIGTTIYNININ